MWLFIGIVSASAQTVTLTPGGDAFSFPRQETRFVAQSDPGAIAGATVEHRSSCTEPTSSGPGVFVVTFDSVEGARAFRGDPRACALHPLAETAPGAIFGLAPMVMFPAPTDRPVSALLAIAKEHDLVVQSSLGQLYYAKWEGVCGWEIVDRLVALDASTRDRFAWHPDGFAEVCSDGM